MRAASLPQSHQVQDAQDPTPPWNGCQESARAGPTGSRWACMAQPRPPLTSGVVRLELQLGGAEAPEASLLCRLGCLCLKVIPTVGPPQSLRRPAPDPILASRSPGPPFCVLTGSSHSEGSAARPERACRLPFWGGLYSVAEGHCTLTHGDARWRPMRKRRGGRIRPRSPADLPLPPRPSGALATCCRQLAR